MDILQKHLILFIVTYTDEDKNLHKNAIINWLTNIVYGKKVLVLKYEFKKDPYIIEVIIE